MKRCNAVFEGGGVRGIGHVGAACGMEYAGYEFVNLAGSSAGAIVAALLAAGYTCRELKEEMEALDYTKFRGKDFADRFGMAGKAVSLCLNLGIYHTDYLESWIGGLLKQKNMSSFGDIGQTAYHTSRRSGRVRNRAGKIKHCVSSSDECEHSGIF